MPEALRRRREEKKCPTAYQPCSCAIFGMSSVKTIPLVAGPPSTSFIPKIAFFTTPAKESIVAVTKSSASRARSKLLTLNFDISQLPSLRNRAMAGWSAGYPAARVRRQLTPGLISSLSGTAGLPPFICFSTNYPEMDFAEPRNGLGVSLTQNSWESGGNRLVIVQMGIDSFVNSEAAGGCGGGKR